MAEKSVFEKIKKQNGERFAKAIRSYDNGIFDILGIVDIVKYAGREAEPIMQYLESLKGIEIEAQSVYKDPITLLSEAGYDAWYADTLKKQNAIEKYFEAGERLCTFRDPDRFKNYYIINAVRKDVDKIKREDFRGKERREDEYGTSVISIQVLKTGGFISIKNRYNHTVSNPDNTFGSNPDMIIRGLANSIRHHFHVDFSSHKVNLPDGFILIDNKPVKTNREINGVYFGNNFYVKDGVIHPIDKDKELLMDNFIFNIKDKTVKNLLDDKDCFPKVLMDEVKDKKVQVTKDKEGCHHLFADNVELATIQNGQITALNLPTTQKIGNNFLYHSSKLTSFKAPLLKEVKNKFLYAKETLGPTNLATLEVPSLQKVGNCFINGWNKLSVLFFPSLQEVGDHFLSTSNIVEFHAPHLKKVGDSFLYHNEELSILDTPSLKKIGWSLSRKFWDYLTDMDKGFFYSFGNYLMDYDPYFLRSNYTYKTNAPALVKRLPPERILKKDFSLKERLTDSANSSVPMREMLKDQAHQPESSAKAKSKPTPHHKKPTPKRFLGKLWDRIKPHD